ncbi:uracil-DNA glycosylase [Piscinibacter sp.]|uniref:uracil-DNA glycosylase n=1 Tax=Piscinibacter sp. TaxID=1903157 RepID=UPI002E04BEEF|nr:uracil-DNA glycosylase [Burkholderiaceae bacterium]
MWSERQIAMLREMGIRLWPDTHQDKTCSPLPPSERGEGKAEALPGLDLSSPPPASVRAELVEAPAHPELVEGAELVEAPARGTRGDISRMDWGALREAVAACTACKLCESRRQTVFGVGNPHAHWMIVGEAPGEQEDIQGEPFVGKSGQLLDSMLRAIGLGRQASTDPARQVFIANTLKCRPPGNRNPEPEELARCEPFLIRQIELVQPKIILAMGRFAVQSLLRSNEPIGKLRGRVHRYHGVPLIVTYHPAYLLRNLEDKARAWDDLCLALETAEGLGPPR